MPGRAIWSFSLEKDFETASPRSEFWATSPSASEKFIAKNFAAIKELKIGFRITVFLEACNLKKLIAQRDAEQFNGHEGAGSNFQPPNKTETTKKRE